jgi:hypothetical protein
MRTCNKCKKPKALEEFSRDRNHKDGRTYDCKLCRAAKHRQWTKDNPEKVKETNERYAPYRKQYYQKPEVKLKHRKRHIEKKYNISYSEYEKMLDAQLSLCYICNRPEPQERNEYLAVDHCHKTGKIRKLLCSRCNMVVGLLEENFAIADKIKEYIKNHANPTDNPL